MVVQFLCLNFKHDVLERSELAEPRALLPTVAQRRAAEPTTGIFILRFWVRGGETRGIQISGTYTAWDMQIFDADMWWD